MNEVSVLVCSTTRGRYALDRPDGPDVTADCRLVVLLGGEWIAGTVEHGRVYCGEGDIERGYYFIADNVGRCGLSVCWDACARWVVSDRRRWCHGEKETRDVAAVITEHC